jgi:hypothetical protein
MPYSGGNVKTRNADAAMMNQLYIDPSVFNRPAVEGDRSKQEKLF